MATTPSPSAPSSSPTPPPDGVLPRLRRRLFGTHDPVDAQLADIARQGAGMARLAHACAFLLIVLFSLGSLVALGGDALASILQERSMGRVDLPATISVAVSTVLVLCMDTGMLYAASMLRVLNARRAEAAEKRLHYAVMVVVALLEAATYAYMSARYEAPHSAVVWALILARAGAAPILSIYLSMARPLPVGPRDILYQVELASGKGVIRDAVTVANDTSAPLERKMALYAASALMTPTDRARLDAMIAVVQQETVQKTVPPLPAPLAGHLETLEALTEASTGTVPQDPPDGPDTPPSSPKPRRREPFPSRKREDFPQGPSLALLPHVPARHQAAVGKRSRAARDAARGAARDQGRRTIAFAILDQNPLLSRKALRQALHCRQTEASALYVEWENSQRLQQHALP